MNQNIIDTPVPPIGVPILTPSKVAKVKSMAKNGYGAGISMAKNTNDAGKSIAKKDSDVVRKKIADWIRGYIPEPIKKPVNEKIEAIMQLYRKGHSQSFEIRESDSALKGFAKRCVIDGHQCIDPKSFMREIKSQVVDLLNKNRQNKVYLALKCVVEKRDMSTGEVVTAEPGRYLLCWMDQDATCYGGRPRPRRHC